MTKAIISCAITGSLHTPTMSEFLPLPPVQIAEVRKARAKIGSCLSRGGKDKVDS